MALTFIIVSTSLPALLYTAVRLSLRYVDYVILIDAGSILTRPGRANKVLLLLKIQASGA